MRRITMLVVAASLVAPVAVLAGNAQPRLYLEVYGWFEEPDPMPAYVCVHPVSDRPTPSLACYTLKPPYTWAAIPIHVGKLDYPICPTIGPECVNLGGFRGVSLGVKISGEFVNFMDFHPCPGFLAGPCDPPAAILCSSAFSCRDWWDHPCYLSYLNMSVRSGATYFDVVGSSTDGQSLVINCSSQYDYGTIVGGRAQWGGAKTITCEGGPTDVERTTWGMVKSLFR